VSPNLTAISIIGLAGATCGAGTLLAMRYFSDQSRIRVVKRRVHAHFQELRLFADDPVLVLRAQENLLLWNLRYLRHTLIPVAIVIVPAFFIAAQLEALFARRPLNPGEAAIVTLQTRPGIDLNSMNPVLTAPSPFQVETPAVRIDSLHQVCWRVRAREAGDSTLRLSLPGGVMERRIRAGPGLAWVGYPWVRYQWSLRSDLAESITIEYPAAEISWPLWFGSFWIAAMLTLRRRFGVTF
jgi:hypothetical protein